MLQRMFLCWCWWRRSELPALLHGTLDSTRAAEMPELHGFDRFERAARGAFATKESILDEILLAKIAELLAGRSEGEESDVSCQLGE